MNKGKLITKDLCFLALFVAVIAVMSQLAIPLPFVPITLQTFAVALAGVILGAKKGALALLIYLALGALGLPVFSGFRGGFQAIAGPTGGYLFSFPTVAFIVGVTADKNKKSLLALGLTLGCIINLTAGSLWLAYSNKLPLQTAFLFGFVPFIAVELIKYALVYAFAPKVKLALQISK